MAQAGFGSDTKFVVVIPAKAGIHTIKNGSLVSAGMTNIKAITARTY